MFTVKERNIYKFHDGVKQRAVDPLKVWSKYLNLHKDRSEDIKFQQLVPLINIPLPDGSIKKELDMKMEREIKAAEDRTLLAIRQAFGVKDFDETDMSGMTDQEIVLLWDDFVNFMMGLKKNQVISQDSLPSTETPPETLIMKIS